MEPVDEGIYIIEEGQEQGPEIEDEAKRRVRFLRDMSRNELKKALLVIGVQGIISGLFIEYSLAPIVEKGMEEVTLNHLFWNSIHALNLTAVAWDVKGKIRDFFGLRRSAQQLEQASVPPVQDGQ